MQIIDGGFFSRICKYKLSRSYLIIVFLFIFGCSQTRIKHNIQPTPAQKLFYENNIESFKTALIFTDERLSLINFDSENNLYAWLDNYKERIIYAFHEEKSKRDVEIKVIIRKNNKPEFILVASPEYTTMKKSITESY